MQSLSISNYTCVTSGESSRRWIIITFSGETPSRHARIIFTTLGAADGAGPGTTTTGPDSHEYRPNVQARSQ
jgi:hypothetical protein